MASNMPRYTIGPKDSVKALALYAVGLMGADPWDYITVKYSGNSTHLWDSALTGWPW